MAISIPQTIHRLKKNILIDIITALFILLFLYTGGSKLLDHYNFNRVISSSPLIGNYGAIVSWVIPILEIIIATLLFIPKTKKIGLYMSTGLMIIFTGYIGYMINFTPDLPCSCGGVISKMDWNQHFVFNIAFTLLGIWGLWLHRKEGKVNNSN